MLSRTRATITRRLRTACGWTGTAPRGSSAGPPTAPGSPSPSGRTRCGTRSSPPPSTPACRSATCRKPPPTPIPHHHQVRPRSWQSGPACHLHRRRLPRWCRPVRANYLGRNSARPDSSSRAEARQPYGQRGCCEYRNRPRPERCDNEASSWLATWSQPGRPGRARTASLERARHGWAVEAHMSVAPGRAHERGPIDASASDRARTSSPQL